MTDRIRMRHLRCFLQVAKHRSVTRAAQELNTAQPSVSRALKELEDELGVALFRRSSRGLTPTQAGETLIAYVKSGIAQIDQGFSVLRGEHGDRQVSIGALPNVVRVLMPDAIAKIKQYYPEIDIRLKTNTGPEMMAELRSGQIDFLVGRLMSPGIMKGMSFEHLYYEPLVFACRSGHPLSRQARIEIEEIDRYEVIVPNAETIIRTELDHFLLSKGFARFTNMIETLSFEFSRKYIQNTDAIIFQPLGAIRQELTDGSVSILNIPAEELMGSVGLTILAGKTVSNAAALMQDTIRQVVGDQNLT